MKEISIYLIPTLLAEGQHASSLPPEINRVIAELNIFFVENIKSARRFIASLKTGKVIDSLTFYELNKDTNFEQVFTLFEALDQNAGILSDAGCPGVADPGALAISIAHQLSYRVVPLVGPSSILLALMASGFSGQNFAFHGYLPIDKKQCVQKLKDLERAVYQTDQTQLFMETPYRNMQLFHTILSVCNSNTKLSISASLTAADAFSKTTSIKNWKKMEDIDLRKKPAIFSFGC